MSIIAVRVNDALKTEISRQAEAANQNKSEFIRQILEKYMEQSADEAQRNKNMNMLKYVGAFKSDDKEMENLTKEKLRDERLSERYSL